MDGGGIPQVILNLALEIICLVTGEDYMVVRKLSRDFKSSSDRRSGWRKSHTSIMEPDLSSEKPAGNNDTILHLTNKIIELLTGEVPVRCEDVAVYLSLEEREYLEEHQDRYKEAMMEDQQLSQSLDGSSIKDNNEECLSPLYSQHSIQETGIQITHNYQDEDDDTTEVMCLRSMLRHTEEDVFPEIQTDEHHSVTDQENQPVLDEYRCVNDQKNHPILDLDEHHFVNDQENHPNLALDEHHFVNDQENHPNLALDEHHFVNDQNHPNLSLDDEFKVEEIILDSSRDSLVEQSFSPVPCPAPSSMPLSSDPSPDHTEHPAYRHPEKFPCFECGQSLSKKELISCQTFHEGQSLSCTVCGKCFAKRSCMSHHQLIHTKEKPFCCPDCGKSYTDRSRLVRHRKTHTGVLPFSCSVCGKSFTERSQVIRHQRTHTGERPFSCSECGKCFSQKTTLITHKRRHTGEKPYHCYECGKCFTDHSALSKHRRIHNGVRPFLCSECGKGFTQKISLVKHQKVHMGE